MVNRTVALIIRKTCQLWRFNWINYGTEILLLAAPRVTVCNGAFYLLHILLTIGLTTLKRENHLIFFIIYFFICLFIYFVFQAVDQGGIYALRYELCDGLAISPDLTDKDPRREMWNFFSPIALFASKPISKRKSELLPVAIQMDFTPGIYDSTFSLSTKIYTKNNWNLIL